MPNPFSIAQEIPNPPLACPDCSGLGSTRQDYYPVPVWTPCTCSAATA